MDALNSGRIRIKADITINSQPNNAGDNNTGYGNFGICNTGNYNRGNFNAGDRNDGNCNTGHNNSGCSNTGGYNSGIYNSGGFNEGNFNTGNCNKGDYNTGWFNGCNGSTGVFNTPKCKEMIYMFDKPTTWTYDEFIESDAARVLMHLVQHGIFEHPEKAQEIWDHEIDDIQKHYIITMPNFNPFIFRKYTNIAV